MYGQGCWEAQAGVEAPQGAGGNGVWRSGAVSTLRPKHSQPRVRQEPGDYTGAHFPLSLSGDMLLSPRTPALALGASATRNSLRCSGCPCSKDVALLNVSSAVVETPCRSRGQQPR